MRIGEAGKLSCVIILRYAASNFGGKRKNPSRISANGVRAKQLTIAKASRWTGPVKRRSDYFSTGRLSDWGFCRRPNKARLQLAPASVVTAILAIN
jgi:hypothetical protein